MKTQITAIAAGLGALAISSAAAAQSEHKMEHPAQHKMEHADHCGMPAGEGTLNGVDIKKSTANISHKPIDSIGWKEMTMDFAVLKPVDLAAFAPGERIHFLLKEQKDKSYAIAALCSLEADEGAHEACMAQMRDTAMKAATEAGMTCSMDGMDDMKMEHGGMSGESAKAPEDHSAHH